MSEFEIHNKDNRLALSDMADNSVDAIVTDCPYGLSKEQNPVEILQSWITTGHLDVKGRGFMGKEWDSFVPQPAFWKEVFRVLKPGGYVLAFFGCRTYDWGTISMRLAGFEIRDQIQWIFGSGFPKSLDVSKAIDKRKDWTGLQLVQDLIKNAREKIGISQSEAARRIGLIEENETLGGGGYMWFETGKRVPTREQYLKLKSIFALDDSCDATFEHAEREVIGQYSEKSAPGGFGDHRFSFNSKDITTSSTEAAKQWEGYGTSLKPAYEPICVARKPLDGTVANNVLTHGCGAINIDGCRIPFKSHSDLKSATIGTGTNIIGGNYVGGNHTLSDRKNIEANDNGRFPANIIFDEQSAQVLDEQTGVLTSGIPSGIKSGNNNNVFGQYEGGIPVTGFGDSGGASRFFYCAKSSKADRNYGCEGLDKKTNQDYNGRAGQNNSSHRPDGSQRNPVVHPNNHPTVKPISLMRYLCKLVKTPLETCTILDPFMGSGTTGVACMLEGINFIGIELDPESFAISQQRINHAQVDFEKEKHKPKQLTLL